MKEYTDSWWTVYIDKKPYTCSVCKFADEYVASWWYPYFDPTCLKGHSCKPNKDGCCDFQMIGRFSR